MKIKKCVGVIIYNNEDKIFLMSSPKWKSWVVPGGRIGEEETEEQTLHREIMEELGIKITNLIRLGDRIKLASSDFFDDEIEFHFKDYIAQALDTNIKPNEEIEDYGWFKPEEALENLELIDSTRKFIEDYLRYKGNQQK